MNQAQCLIHEVEIVVQALATVRPRVGLVGLLVVPRLVSVASLHRRDDMHQTGMLAASLQHLCRRRFLADMLLADVLDGQTRFRGQCRRLLAHPLARRFGKPGVIEDAEVVGVEELRHPVRVAHRRQRPGDRHPVVA